MGGWYWIGVSVGLGTAAGVLLAGVLTALSGGARWALLVAAALAGVAGASIGVAIDSFEPGGWANWIGGIIGAVGGTRGGTAALVTLAAIVLGALALVPVVGYLEALALPTLAARLRRRMPDKHAGLRSLARD
jgi:hypothetical protein